MKLWDNDTPAGPEPCPAQGGWPGRGPRRSPVREFELFVDEDEAGLRLDLFVVRRGVGSSRAQIQRLIAEGEVRVNGEPAKPSTRVSEGDHVWVRLANVDSPLTAFPEPLPVPVLYEDQDLLVVNKPKGMVVHPAVGSPSGTLVNALLARTRLSSIGGTLRPGIVHRIDKDTSGVLVVAKSDRAHYGLVDQFKAHSITRAYLALVHGEIRKESGRIDAPLGRHPFHRQKMAVQGVEGKPAVTRYWVREAYPGYTLVECRLETGRTHQIRVHMAFLGHPLVGDPMYGGKRPTLGLAGQALHAYLLGFVHPTTGRYMEFRAPLPQDFRAVLSRLRASRARPGVRRLPAAGP